MEQQSGKMTETEKTKEELKRAYNRRHYGDLIRKRRIQLGLTQEQLGRSLGVTKAYVTHWEAGRIRPDLNLVPALCKKLGITLSAFFQVPEEDSRLTETEMRLLGDYRSLSGKDRRVVEAVAGKLVEMAAEELWDRCKNEFHRLFHSDQTAAAGGGAILTEDTPGETVYVRNTRLSERADEIVTVSGASMEPVYFDGQDVYVEHTPELRTGEIGLFVVNGEGYIKEYQDSYLHSLNPGYADIPLGEYDEMRIIGRVLGAVDGSDYPTQEERAILAEIKE